MEITPEIQAVIDEKVKEEAQKASVEIINTLKENYEKKIEDISAEREKDKKAFKDTIAEIINGKNVEEKTKMEILVDEINEKRKIKRGSI